MIILVVVAGATAVVIWQWKSLAGIFSKEPQNEFSFEELWNSQRYEEINNTGEEILVNEPLNSEALLYNGFSYFYRGVNQFSFEEKIVFIDRAIQNLRKAKILDVGELYGPLLYVLGKAYYYKGKYYSDLAILYLNEAAAAGYVGDDTYEYLGLAYSDLSNYEKSVASFTTAVASNPTDMRYLALAQAYFNQGNVEKAEEYLVRTLNKTRDPAVEKRTRFLLGKIYYESDQYIKAEDQYNKIIESDPKSADAYYFLGEIFLAYNKAVEARNYWREASRIDPSHYGANRRLYD
ncbi:MAG: tetratricopeptide repeat protein [Spirochaetales bacterium]|nr:tetratricopeptide repeat protein [Spirochaetales bacterium]